jgi:hypothetical protein
MVQHTASARSVRRTSRPAEATTTGSDAVTAVCAARVRPHQRRRASAVQPQDDRIVSGSDASGAVVARRVAENPEVSVLFLEMGGDDDVSRVTAAPQWAHAP